MAGGAGGDDGTGAKSPLSESASAAPAEGEKDKRFYKQTIETGEEGETTMFQIGRAHV